MTGDMTKGSSYKILIAFAVPMILGNVFQQLYSTTDAIIVGRLIGKNALAAVGVANPIMSIAIFFIFGICIGTSVLMSQLFGAGKLKALKKEVSTALIAGIFFTAVMSVFFVFISRWILMVTGTPNEIVGEADVFLKIIFGGLIFSFLYNYYSSALRAIGDSKTPLIFLIISCVLNGVLCYVFVAFFRFGVAGSAVATVIAQAVSSILCIVYVYMKIPMIKLSWSELIIDRDLLKRTIQYSWVSALQQTCLYVGRLLVQGVVNPFGANAIAAFNSVTRVDGFVLAPGDSFAASVATFSAQNKGAGRKDRIVQGYKDSNIIITIYSVITALAVFLCANPIMRMFVAGTESAVIRIGVDYLRIMSVFYVLSGFCNILQGLFRGIGRLHITLNATLMQITLRVILSYALAPYLGVTSVCYAVGVGWMLMIIYEGAACRKYFKEKSLVVS